MTARVSDVDTGSSQTRRITLASVDNGDGAIHLSGRTAPNRAVSVGLARCGADVVIGDRNVIRESCTVNRGTTHDKHVTTIGNDNLFMAYSHVAHDCVLGDNLVFAKLTGTGVADAPGRFAAVAPGLSTLKQTSLTVRPVSMPPASLMPSPKRVLMLALAARM